MRPDCATYQLFFHYPPEKAAPVIAEMFFGVEEEEYRSRIIVALWALHKEHGYPLHESLMRVFNSGARNQDPETRTLSEKCLRILQKTTGAEQTDGEATSE